jgi:hypothetical protein
MKAIISTICAVAGAIWLPNESFADSADSVVRTLEYAHPRHGAEARRPAVPLNREVSGVIPRVSRGGNPLELLNPFASAKYGTAEENTVPELEEPGRAQGIKLLSFSF